MSKNSLVLRHVPSSWNKFTQKRQCNATINPSVAAKTSSLTLSLSLPPSLSLSHPLSLPPSFSLPPLLSLSLRQKKSDNALTSGKCRSAEPRGQIDLQPVAADCSSQDAKFGRVILFLGGGGRFKNSRTRLGTGWSLFFDLMNQSAWSSSYRYFLKGNKKRSSYEQN